MNQTPEKLADEALRRILFLQGEGAPVVRVDSPPGAGKTGVVERVVSMSRHILKERTCCVTQTNEQLFALARRFASSHPGTIVHILARKGLSIPSEVALCSNISVIQRVTDAGSGPCIVMSNGAKWAWAKGAEENTFDLMVVDEAHQMPDYRFHQVAGLARRFVLVGDPGQIGPVIACPIDRWRSDPAGPHVPCPVALVERHPWVPIVQLPVTRRLPPDTTSVIQPIFYPHLPFVSMAKDGERKLNCVPSSFSSVDQVIDITCSGKSVSMLELPGKPVAENDIEAAEIVVAIMERLFDRGAHVTDESGVHPLTPAQTGVVCTHVSQVSAVRERLANWFANDVLVETADRYQGLEKQVIIALHPLSGSMDAVSDFHLDAGRLCVMLSRHRVACIVVAREGIRERLIRHVPAGNRVLGIEMDPEYEGWEANLKVIETLSQTDRSCRV